MISSNYTNDEFEDLIGLQQIQADANELGRFFNDDSDSLLSLEGIFPEAQFRDVAKQLQMDPINRQSIAYKFYKKTKPPTSAQQNLSKYYLQYLRWKSEPKEVEGSLPNLYAQKQTNILKSQKKHEEELLKYKEELRKKQEKILEMQLQKNLRHISQQYQSKLNSVLAQSDRKNSNHILGSSQAGSAIQKAKQLGFSKLEYPLISATSLQGMEAKVEKRKQQWLQLKQRSYVDLVRNPPKQKLPSSGSFKESYTTESLKNNTNSAFEKFSEATAKKQWKIDVDQILKMPAKQFLLFYNHYSTKLVSLTSPEELKRINTYRKSALEKQEAIEKLKIKISHASPETLAQISRDKKNQLFQLLYQEDVEKEIGSSSHR